MPQPEPPRSNAPARGGIDDESILAALRSAAAVAGTPLSAERYDAIWRDHGGASAARVIQRFGSWNAACAAAGLATNRGRAAYRRSWTRESLLAAVADYLVSEGAAGSYADYARWARTTQGAPSAQTVRNYLGSWGSAKEDAAALLEARPPVDSDD